MNKILSYFYIGVSALTLFSCNDLEDVNTDPNSPSGTVQHGDGRCGEVDDGLDL